MSKMEKFIKKLENMPEESVFTPSEILREIGKEETWQYFIGQVIQKEGRGILTFLSEKFNDAEDAKKYVIFGQNLNF